MDNNKYPAINRYIPETTSGRDFLGQQSIIQVMANECIPSFTNSTKRLRYYSFWAWAFQMLKNNMNYISSNKRWLYLQKLETTFIICNNLRQPDITGMPGINSITIPDITTNKSEQINIYSENTRVTNSFTPVQYSPSLNYLNIVSREGTKYSIGHFGSILADIFNNEIKKCDGYEDLIDPNKNSIRFDKLLSLQSAFSLDNVLSEEKPIFIEIIEKKERLNSHRIPTTLLLLDIIINNKIDNPVNILKPILKNEYTLPNNLIEISGGWLIIKSRQYYQYSIEAILHSFLNYISQQTYGVGNFTHYCKLLYKNFKDNLALIKDNNINKMINNNHTLKEVIDELSVIFKNKNINEEILIFEGLNNSFDNNIFAIAQIGLFIQFILVKKYNLFEEHPSSIAKRFLTIPNGFKHSYTKIYKIYSESMHMSFSSAIEKIITELVFLLHIGVSQIKWNQTGNFSFKFAKADDYGYFRTDIRNININMTNNKLSAYLSLLKDLGFWKYDKEIIVITEEGKEYYNSKINSYL